MQDSDQLVTITLDITKYDTSKGKVFDAFWDLQELIEDVIEKQKFGEVDGHEFCQSPDKETITYFIYGPDPQKIITSLSTFIASLPKTMKPTIHCPTLHSN